MSIKDKYNLTEDQWATVVEATNDSLLKEASFGKKIKDKAGKMKKSVSDFMSSDAGKAFTAPLIGGAAAATVALGVPAVVDEIREHRVKGNKNKYIASMKEVFPELKDIPKKDIDTAYNSIAIHSPHVLRDPLVGGQTLKSFASYRQADLENLANLNKLKGGTLMDQAVLNATNYAASGIAEGFKGYRAQRMADKDQAYRAKMDQFRVDMDKARFDLEKARAQEQIDQFDHSFGQRERQHADQMGASQMQFSYRQDEDARAESRWLAEQGVREHSQQLKQIELAQKDIKQVRAKDDQGNNMVDGNGNPVYINQPGVSVNTIVGRLRSAQTPQRATLPTPSLPAKKTKGKKSKGNRTLISFSPEPQGTYDSRNKDKIKNIKSPTMKAASNQAMYDILLRLRARN